MVFLLLEFLQVVFETVEALVPEPAILFEPG